MPEKTIKPFDGEIVTFLESIDGNTKRIVEIINAEIIFKDSDGKIRHRYDYKYLVFSEKRIMAGNCTYLRTGQKTEDYTNQLKDGEKVEFLYTNGDGTEDFRFVKIEGTLVKFLDENGYEAHRSLLKNCVITKNNVRAGFVNYRRFINN